MSTRPRHLTAPLLLTAALLVGGCSAGGGDLAPDDTASDVAPDTGGETADAGPDVEAGDAVDSGAEVATPDGTSPGDTGPEDISAEDISIDDISVEDTSIDDISVEDISTEDATADGPDAEEVDAPVEPPEPVEVETDPHCENLVSLFCPLPWPSSRWLTPDEQTVTGYRLDYDPEGVPKPLSGQTFDTTPFERLDGFSPSSQLITLFEEPVDVTALAGHGSIGLSLDADHATRIIDLETGELVAHWVENDARAEAPDETLFYLHPAARLKANHPYAVAISTGLVGESGAELMSSPGFAALRDGVPTTSPEIEARRAAFESLFASLAEAGAPRGELLLAWEFHTASDDAIRARLLAMRADALEQLGPEGIGCTVTKVDEGFKGGGRRVQGTVSVPWYLDAAQPPATFVYGDDGSPEFQGTEEVAFTAIVPAALLESDEPGPLVTWGHGLFGEAKGTVSHQAIVDVAEEFGSVIVATDWHGMSSKDLIFLATVLTDTSQFYLVGENLQQGMINTLTLTRSMLGACRLLPDMASEAGEPVIDPTRSYFLGGSQGSILGATQLTLSPDTDRGALIVGGANFSFMIERSTHFTKFETFLAPSYGSRLVTGTLMAFSQHVWDDAETAAWIGATTTGVDGIGPKSFVYLIVENDPQVTNLSSDIAARTAGIPVLQGSVRLPWGVPVVEGPVEESVFISFDLGEPATPEGNLSPDVDMGGHGAVGLTAPAREMVTHFFETGEVYAPCAPDCTLAP